MYPEEGDFAVVPPELELISDESARELAVR